MTAAPRLDADRAGVAPAAARVLTVAVAGNPNCGKSTLVNAIAGTRLQVGNWPGVTVEKKEASFEHRGTRIRLVDLPGVYSMSPYSQEEVITREYLARERPDLVLDVVDSTNLERNLYLTVQLLELGIPVVMALNIHDEAEAKGYRIDAAGMERLLGIRVVPTSATKRRGLVELLDALLASGGAGKAPAPLRYGPDVEVAADRISEALRSSRPRVEPEWPLRWTALKLMEGDPRVSEEIRLEPALLDGALHHLRTVHGPDVETAMAEARYALAAGLCREVLRKPELPRKELTERIDRVVLNRFLGIPVFLAAMWLVFKLTFDLSAPFGDFIRATSEGPFKRWAAALLGAIAAPGWTVSLVNDGVIAGVGFVLVFVPVIFAMMFFITFLEGSGYMARAAFVMDKAMHAVGLHGKSFIPLLLGFGCNVPAIYATRTLESRRDKALTALLVPLMSCGARLPVYVVFVGALFPARSGTVVWSLYVLGMALAIGMGIVFKRTLFRGEAPIFIMELPPYRMPALRSLLLHTWEKGKHFLVKAGTYILAVTVVVWFLLHLPWGVESRRDSYLGKAGRAVAPALAPLGFGTWEAASSLITGVIAKEIVVGTMGEIYAQRAEERPGEAPTFVQDLREIGTSFAKAVRESLSNVLSRIGLSSLSVEAKEEHAPLEAVIQRTFTPLSAYAFMVFVLLYMPCMVVAAAMRQEFGSWRWFGVMVAYQTALAWLAAFAVYQGGRLLGLGG
ncbi:MAG TPA: ferrous iron transport protein B [Anaeromyxobacter sp.]